LTEPASENRSPGQSLHVPLPLSSLKDPGGQDKHASLPSREKVPGAHSLQVPPPVAPIFPAEHAAHTIDAADGVMKPVRQKQWENEVLGYRLSPDEAFPAAAMKREEPTCRALVAGTSTERDLVHEAATSLHRVIRCVLPRSARAAGSVTSSREQARSAITADVRSCANHAADFPCRAFFANAVYKTVRRLRDLLANPEFSCSAWRCAYCAQLASSCDGRRDGAVESHPEARYNKCPVVKSQSLPPSSEEAALFESTPPSMSMLPPSK